MQGGEDKIMFSEAEWGRSSMLYKKCQAVQMN